MFPSGSLIPFDVTGRLDESLLFNGAGMVQFKPFFRGTAEPENRRLTTAQKCVRTGDIESVGDPSHLTFFEMLGNFSFGDYFKKEAIAFSWEFLFSSEWLGLDPANLVVTVFEEDEEAFGYWSEHWQEAGFNPEHKIFRLSEETNYWPAGSFSAGPPGPCGPNSEMFYWTGHGPAPKGPYSKEDFLRDDADGKWLEIWNDVFIQYEWQGHLRNPERPSDGFEKDGLVPLPFQSIDTGMGLDRTVVALSGLRSVYDTDAFAPILKIIEELSDSESPYRYGQEGTKDRAARIIADHIRTAVFCIADGILPANNGRGYVLRRLIRRAVLKGHRTLGFEKPFFHLVYEGVAESMGDHYKELIERREVILETLRNEEELFRRTVNQGSVMLQHTLNALLERQNQTGIKQHLPGDAAFKLYDTFGFPLEVTQELCEEAGIRVDDEGYDAALKEAQERSRGASGMESVYGGVVIQIQFGSDEEGGKPTPTAFLGYQALESQSRIVGALPQLGEDGTPTGDIVLALDQTPFYASSGGQISDEGLIEGDGISLRIVDLHKQDGLFVHLAEPIKGVTKPLGMSPEAAREVIQKDLFNQVVHAKVDRERRRSIQRNHSATHLLHAALRNVLGKHVTQAGSYVGPDRLRFDFTHGKAMTHEELSEVERIVNERCLENTEVVTYVDIPIAEAKARGAMALFGEKYGNKVRMVEIGDFSRELCGGTHVKSTGEIGLFKVVSESSAASGVRRIEAITGMGAYRWAIEEFQRVRETALALRSNSHDVVQAANHLQEQLREERRKRERAEGALIRGGSASDSTQVKSVKGVDLWAPTKFEGIDSKIVAASVDDQVAKNPNLVALAAVVTDGKVLFTCKVGSEAVKKGVSAGKLVGEVAKVAGGGGGGRPDFATAGGKLLDKVDDALAAVEGILTVMISG